MVPSVLLTAPAWLGELQTCDYFIASLTAFSPYSLGETCSHIVHCYSKWRHVYDWATQMWHARLDPARGTKHSPRK